MSSYVDALKRWRLEDQQVATPAAVQGLGAAARSPFDRLYERLQMASNGSALRAIVFAGVSGGEGVGSVVMSFAERLRATRSVLVVLADTHVVRAAVEAPLLDLAKLVAEAGTLPAAEPGTLRVVGMPARHVGASQLLASPAFHTWLAEQAPQFDQILIEAPPALKYAEAAILGKQGDGVVLVARANVTQTGDIGQAQRVLVHAGVRVLGAVLTQVEAPPSFLRRVLMPELVDVDR